MRGTYDPWLVALSFVVAVCVSYTALNLASRVSSARQQYVRLWLAGGAFAMGVGIWSMHFVGMLAFTLPIGLVYDVPITLASLAVGILVSAFALSIASRSEVSQAQLLAGALAMGIGIATMHYSGMAAIRIIPAIRYEPWILLASIAIAIAASYVALWLFFRLRRNFTSRIALARLAAAGVMGIGICGMHYTGMFASRFAADSYCLGAAQTNNAWLALTIGAFAIGILLTTMMLVVFDTHLDSRSLLHVTAMQHADAQLQHLATHDPLTGLPNRLLLEDRE